VNPDGTQGETYTVDASKLILNPDFTPDAAEPLTTAGNGLVMQTDFDDSNWNSMIFQDSEGNSATYMTPERGLNLRDKPGTGSNVMLTIPPGYQFDLFTDMAVVVGADGQTTEVWYEVTYVDNSVPPANIYKGWVFGGSLVPVNP
jgi:Bacterial SH3 domain